jgi:hypothetical protein
VSNCSGDTQEEFKEKLKSLSDERLEDLIQEHREETGPSDHELDGRRPPSGFLFG